MALKGAEGRLHLIHVEVTDKHQGEHLDYYPLQAGDVVVMDRAYNQAQKLIDQADQGVSVVLRYNPHSLNVYDAAGMKIDWYEELKTTQDIERCVRFDGKPNAGWERDTASARSKNDDHHFTEPR